jgi:hypothetical protein
MSCENNIGAWQARVMTDPNRPGAWMPAVDEAWARAIYETYPGHVSEGGIQTRPLYISDNVTHPQIKNAMAAYLRKCRDNGMPDELCGSINHALNEMLDLDYLSPQTINSQTIAQRIKATRKPNFIASLFRQVFKRRHDCQACADTGYLPDGHDCDWCGLSADRMIGRS